MPVVVTHERLGTWARQLRPRLAATSTRLVETRSAAELASTVREGLAPIILIDLGDCPHAMLEDLAAIDPRGLILVLDPGNHPGLPQIARELGATLTFSGVVPPPRVADLIARWIPIARLRAEADGWSAPSPEASSTYEPWLRFATTD